MNILPGMGEVEPLQSVIMLETPIMALKEVAIRMKGHTMWPTILKTCPIMKVANIATYETILIGTSMVRIYRIGLISTVLDAYINPRMNPSIFVKGSQKSKTILSTNRLQIYKRRYNSSKGTTTHKIWRSKIC